MIIKDRNPIADPIQQSEAWMECLKHYGWVIHKTKNAINVPVLNTFMGGMVKIYRPKLLTQGDLIEIEEIAKKYKAMFIRIEADVGQDEQVLKSAGFISSPHPVNPTKSAYFDLSMDFTKHWANLSPGLRYSITRAKREGTTVEVFSAPKEDKLREFFTVHQDTAKLKGFGAKPFDDMKLRAGFFGEDAILFMAYDKNHNLCSGSLFLGYKGSSTYVYGGTTTLGRKNKAGYYLQWRILEELKKLGYSYADFEGLIDERLPATVATYGGFSHFKERYNPIIVEFPLPYVKLLSPVLKLLRKIYGNAVNI